MAGPCQGLGCSVFVHSEVTYDFRSVFFFMQTTGTKFVAFWAAIL